MNPQNDIQIGHEALVYFHNEALKFPGYQLTLDEMKTKVSRGHPEILSEGLGLTIRSNEMSDWQVKDAMVSLADAGQGKIPSNMTQFFTALGNRGSNLTAIDWIVATPSIALDTAGDVVSGAQAVGDTLITTGSSLLVIAPMAIIAAVLFIGWSRTKQLAGK